MLEGARWTALGDDYASQPLLTPAELLVGSATLGEPINEADAAVRDALAGVMGSAYNRAVHGTTAPVSAGSDSSMVVRHVESVPQSAAPHRLQEQQEELQQEELSTPTLRHRLSRGQGSAAHWAHQPLFAASGTGPEETSVLYDCTGLATLPAKLVAWHVIRDTYHSQRPRASMALLIKGLGLVFAFIPLLVRAYLGGSVMKALSSWAPLEVAVQVALVWVSYTNSRITFAFCALGAIDLLRRFAAQVALHRLLDTKSPLTLEMHDAMVRSAGGTFLRAMGIHAAAGLATGERGMPSIFTDGHGIQQGPGSETAAKRVPGDAATSGSLTPVHTHVIATGMAPTSALPDKGNDLRQTIQQLDADCDDVDTVRRLIVSQATWLSPVHAERLVQKRMLHLRLPVFYPQNLLSWLHVRNTASDFGRTYAMRIQLYTLYFMALVCVIVVAQVVLFFNLADTPADEAAIVLTLGTYTELIFAGVVLVQMATAARTNRSISFQRRRFNRIEAMTQDLLCANPEPLAPTTEERLKKCRKVLSLLAKSLDSEGDLNPVRVMFIPADFRLVASFLSITGSGVLAALAQLRNVQWGG